MATGRGLETRHRILAAAEECFSARGYDATGVAEICQRSAVTKGGFYHHFPSKHALFVELLSNWLALLDQQLVTVGSQAGTVPEALLAMAEVIEPLFREAGSRLPLFLEFWRQASRDAAVWEATVAPYRRYRSHFAAMVQAGIDEGSIRAVDPDIAAGAIVSLAVGLLMQGLMDPEGADWGSAARQSIAWLVSSLEVGRDSPASGTGPSLAAPSSNYAGAASTQ